MQMVSGIGAGVVLGRVVEGDAKAETAGSVPKEKPLRFVHLTDMHVEDGPGVSGFAAALAAVKKLDPAPAFMITGGDHVMETTKASLAKAQAQWKAYNQVLAAENKLRVYPVLGNHDIWGWLLPDAGVENHASYGKKMGLDELGLKAAYYSFDAGAWHFVILDSQMKRGPVNRGYYAAIDPKQMEWLAADLAKVKKGQQVCVVSHIPILAACVFFDGQRLREDFWHVPDAWMHRDAPELVALFMKHEVKLAVSGHIHLHDVVKYNGITFVCDGAVSDNWWKGGGYHETPRGFGVFDLYADGRVEHAYVGYEWNK
jgi:3',5'-cyclic AMP phosphodiesterase CpdA